MKSEQTAKKQQKRIPWWLTIIGAITTYNVFTYLLPALNPANQALKDLFQLGPGVAPVLTIPFLLLSAKQLYDTELPPEKRQNKDPDET